MRPGIGKRLLERCLWQIDISKCLNIKGCTCRNTPNQPSLAARRIIKASIEWKGCYVRLMLARLGMKAHWLIGGLQEGQRESEVF